MPFFKNTTEHGFHVGSLRGLRQLFLFLLLALLFISTLILTHCASTSPHPQVHFAPYYKALKKGKKEKSLYRNFKQIFQVQGILLSQDVERAQVEQRRQIFKYSPTEIEEELRKIHQDNTQNIRFFLSVYTSKHSLNTLHLPTGFWRTFLHIDGQNIDGKVKPFRKNLIETQVLYPFHTKWHKGYIATFPIPLQDIHGKKIELHLNSPLGNTEILFHK